LRAFGSLLVNTLGYLAVGSGLGVALVQVKYVENDLAQGRLVMPYSYTLRRKGGYHLVSPLEISNDDKIVRFREWLMAQILNPIKTQSYFIA
jgi:LysR family glycine cleavage system transcriptional activator